MNFSLDLNDKLDESHILPVILHVGIMTQITIGNMSDEIVLSLFLIAREEKVKKMFTLRSNITKATDHLVVYIGLS